MEAAGRTEHALEAFRARDRKRLRVRRGDDGSPTINPTPPSKSEGKCNSSVSQNKSREESAQLTTRWRGTEAEGDTPPQS